MVMNPYRFQTVSSKIINWVSKNENQSQRELEDSACTAGTQRSQSCDKYYFSAIFANLRRSSEMK
jgi:hypothetical protein